VLNLIGLGFIILPSPPNLFWIWLLNEKDKNKTKAFG